MTKIISILSAGHSGSTLCDILLGTIPGVFSTGECVYFPWQLYRNGNVCELGQDMCSCGKRFSDCNIWNKVVTILSENEGYNIFEDPFRFKMAMYKSQKYGQSLPKTTKILRALYSRTLQYYPHPLLKKIFTAYVSSQLNNNWLFFDTISQVTKSTHVVDSSKDIIRSVILQYKRPRGDLSIILLIRDIEGVAASAAKHGRDPIEAAQSWIKLYRQYLRIIKKQKNMVVKVIHYETLAGEPEQLRDQLANFLKLPPPSSPLEINTKDYHLVAGNPMRYRGNITIKYDDSWKQVLTPEQKKQVLIMKRSCEPMLAELNSFS